MPASIVYFAIQSLRSGRRSGYAGRQDAMCPAATLDGRVSLASLEEPIGFDENDPNYEVPLHDFLATPGEDGSSEAARRIDWDAALATMDPRMQGILAGTAEGTSNQDIAARYRISPPRCCQVREEAGVKISAAWGGGPVVDATREAAWAKHVRAFAQRRACRAERIARCKAA